MTGLKNCPACGAVIDADDTECKICGISLEGEPSVRSFKDLPPAPEESSVSIPRPSKHPPPPRAKGTPLPRPSQPPLAVPKEQVAVIPGPSDPTSGREIDHTMKVPFSGGNKSAKTPDDPPKVSLPRPSRPPAPPKSLNKTMMMMPAMTMPTGDDNKKVKLPRPSDPPPPPPKPSESEKIPTPSQPPPPEGKMNQTLLGVPAQMLISEEARKGNSESRETQPPTENKAIEPPLKETFNQKPLPKPKPSTPSSSSIPIDTEAPSGKPKGLLIIAASICAVVVVTILIIMFSGDKKEPETPVATENVTTEKTDIEKAAAEKAAAQKADAQKADAQKTAEVEEPAEETPSSTLALLGESEATCKPLEDYPNFPFKSHLSSLQGKLGAKGVCNLFGNLNAAGIKAGFQELPTAGPFDDDLRKGVTQVLVYPGENADEKASSIAFVFSEDRLYEIRFNYIGQYPGKLKSKAFKKTLGSAGRAKKDRHGRWYSTYKDGDMAITQLEEKIKKTKHKWVVFAEPKTLKKVESGTNKKTRRAEKSYAEGKKLVLEHKFNKALKKFRDSRRDRPDFAMAFAAEALLLVRDEKFKLAKKAAANAIEKGHDQRAASQSHNLLAIAALYEGDKASAIEHLKKAEALDPSNKDYSTSIEELETGEYSAQRVAITAARISCLGTVNAKRWTKKGLSARGNFESFKDYKKALAAASKKPAFKKAKRDQQKAECR